MPEASGDEAFGWTTGQQMVAPFCFSPLCKKE